MTDLWDRIKVGETHTFELSWAPIDGDFLDFAVCATEQKSITKKNRKKWI
jgi:hypothetical protein